MMDRKKIKKKEAKSLHSTQQVAIFTERKFMSAFIVKT